jgi:hypothetical protein
MATWIRLAGALKISGTPNHDVYTTTASWYHDLTGVHTQCKCRSATGFVCTTKSSAHFLNYYKEIETKHSSPAPSWSYVLTDHLSNLVLWCYSIVLTDKPSIKATHTGTAPENWPDLTITRKQTSPLLSNKECPGYVFLVLLQKVAQRRLNLSVRCLPNFRNPVDRPGVFFSNKPVPWLADCHIVSSSHVMIRVSRESSGRKQQLHRENENYKSLYQRTL